MLLVALGAFHQSLLRGMGNFLIVEDDSIIAMELQERLQGRGYNVCGVSASGQDAIHQANRLRPDLVLMDIRLRGAMVLISSSAPGSVNSPGESRRVKPVMARTSRILSTRKNC